MKNNQIPDIVKKSERLLLDIELAVHLLGNAVPPLAVKHLLTAIQEAA